MLFNANLFAEFMLFVTSVRPTASCLLQGPLFVAGGRASLGPSEEDRVSKSERK